MTNSDFKLVFETFTKAVYFTFLSSFFGAIQVLAIWILSVISTDMKFDVNDIYLTGFPLFFCIALLSSILIEYFIIEHIKTNPILNSLVLIGCIVIGFSSMLVFGKIYLQRETLDIDNTVLFQNFILLFTFYVTLYLKSLILLKQKLP